jgi:hypothetical protein
MSQMKHLIKSVLIFYFVAIIKIFAQNAGIEASLSESGATALLNSLVPLVEEKIGSLPIPNLPFDQDGFEGSVTDVKCQKLAVGSQSVTFSSTIDVDLEGMSLSCSAGWNFKLKSWPHVPDGSGTVDISVSNTKASMSVGLTTQNLHPQLQCAPVALTIGDINLSFHGSALDWILNLFKSLIENAIKSALDGQVGSAIASFVNEDVNKELSGLNLDLAIAAPPPFDIAEARFGFIAYPVINPSFIGVQMQGDVVPIASPNASLPIPPPSLPPFSPSSDGQLYIEAFISSYTLVSAAYTYFAANLEHWTITPAEIPLGFNETQAYLLVAPGMVIAYPANATVQLIVSVGDVPEVVITNATGIAATLPLLLSFEAENANSTFTEAFAVNAEATLSLSPAVGQNPKVNGGLIITGTFKYINSNLTLNTTNVGPVNVGLLSIFAGVTLEDVIVPILNELLQTGLPIPAADGLSLVNATLTTGDGFILLGSDFSFSPSISGAISGESEFNMLARRANRRRSE